MILKPTSGFGFLRHCPVEASSSEVGPTRTTTTRRLGPICIRPHGVRYGGLLFASFLGRGGGVQVWDVPVILTVLNRIIIGVEH